jgi:hypothetical protein
MAESEKHDESSSVHTLAVVSLIEKDANMKFPREDIEARGHLAVESAWTPTMAEVLVMISLSFISLMVALDASILVCVLPVRSQGATQTFTQYLHTPTGDCIRSQWYISRSILGWHFISSHLCSLPTGHSIDFFPGRPPTDAHRLASILHHWHNILFMCT